MTYPHIDLGVDLKGKSIKTIQLNACKVGLWPSQCQDEDTVRFKAPECRLEWSRNSGGVTAWRVKLVNHS